MLKDVTFGQYYPADSFIHKCDPRTKILYLIIYIVAVFLSPNFYALGACAVVLILSVAFAGVPVKSVLRSVKGVLFLLIFTAILNLFFYAGENTITIAGVALQWGIINITWEGFYFMIFFSCRLFMLVMSSAILTLTTTPVNLTDGLESLLTPLKWVKFPVHVLALIMSIALRFIPTLMDETDRIMNAQKARGADFEHGSLIRRVKAIIPVLIPLLISAFRRAEELGDAMEARCYSGDSPRTKYKKLRFGWRDGIVAVLSLLLLAGVILLKIFTVALI
jgi:energy-coupling factor transport system permease protein